MNESYQGNIILILILIGAVTVRVSVIIRHTIRHAGMLVWMASHPNIITA